MAGPFSIWEDVASVCLKFVIVSDVADLQANAYDV